MKSSGKGAAFCIVVAASEACSERFCPHVCDLVADAVAGYSVIGFEGMGALIAGGGLACRI